MIYGFLLYPVYFLVYGTFAFMLACYIYNHFVVGVDSPRSVPEPSISTAVAICFRSLVIAILVFLVSSFLADNLLGDFGLAIIWPMTIAGGFCAWVVQTKKRLLTTYGRALLISFFMSAPL